MVKSCVIRAPGVSVAIDRLEADASRRDRIDLACGACTWQRERVAPVGIGLGSGARA
jgi:hypothetical protein